MRGPRGEAVSVAELEDQQPEDHRGHELSHELRLSVEPQVPALDELDVVVGEAQTTQGQGESEDEPPGYARAGTRGG